MRILRFLFLAYLTLLLGWFLPSHVRGQITMVSHGSTADPCCAHDAPGPASTPTQSDKANCAVCFWAAGILPEAAAVFDCSPIDLVRIEARNALDQCARVFVRTQALPRGPPAHAC